MEQCDGHIRSECDVQRSRTNNWQIEPKIDIMNEKKNSRFLFSRLLTNEPCHYEPRNVWLSMALILLGMILDLWP